MLFLATALGLLFHSFFWGAGLALLVTPRPWRRYWPIFAPVCGLTLQSTVVWLGIYTSLPGANSYAIWSEGLPLGLLGWGAWQRRRHLVADLVRLRVIWLLILGCLFITVLPLAQSSSELTTSSMGSCDAADYAAGARVLQEFARGDRGGFMGVTEVVRLMSVDNFFDHWVLLNHFTPSALLAHNAAVFGLAQHELISVFTAVLLALSLPIVFWLARAALRYSPGAACFLTALYGISPLTLYAVYHVAIGQLLAAQAIALLTWGGVAIWRGGSKLRSVRDFGLLLAVAYGLILGSYHFIVIVCLVPAVGYAGAMTLWTRAWARGTRWLAVMLLPLALAGGVYAERLVGLRERFLLFREVDFGWRIPVLSPEGWFGIVASHSLSGHDAWLRVTLSAGFVALCAWALWRAKVRGAPWRILSLSVTLPPLAGYAILEAKGVLSGTNASYDAYKLFSVFYPCLLAGFGMWLRLVQAAALRWLVILASGVIVAGNLFADRSMWERMRAPRLIVTEPLAQLQQIESRGDVKSINILMGDVWSRLWANALLLHKSQYFAEVTYEGRNATQLAGAWDLLGDVWRLDFASSGSGAAPAPPLYSLVDTRDDRFVRVGLGDGWHDLEWQAGTSVRWRWTSGDAALVVENPHHAPLHVVVSFNVGAVDTRDLRVRIDGKLVLETEVEPNTSTCSSTSFELPSGRTKLVFESSRQAQILPGKDRRQRGFVFRDICMRILHPIAESGSD